MSNAQFKAAFAELCKRAGDRVDAVAVKVAEDLARRIVLKSPVGDPSQWDSPAPAGYTGGTFRANWNLSFQAPDTSTRQSTGNDALSRARAALVQYRTGQTIFICNSMPYAARLEYEGWSKQAPSGMVRLTVAEYGAALRKAVAAVRQGAA